MYTYRQQKGYEWLMVDWTINRPFAFSTFWMSLSAAWKMFVDKMQHKFERKQITHLHVLTNKVDHLFREEASVIDRAWWHLIRTQDAVLNSDSVIVLTKRRRLVDDTSTIFCCNVCIVYDAECRILILHEKSIYVCSK